MGETDPALHEEGDGDPADDALIVHTAHVKNRDTTPPVLGQGPRFQDCCGGSTPKADPWTWLREALETGRERSAWILRRILVAATAGEGLIGCCRGLGVVVRPREGNPSRRVGHVGLCESHGRNTILEETLDAPSKASVFRCEGLESASQCVLGPAASCTTKA